MQHQVGDLLIGTITSAKPFALFLSFEDGAIGMLHISELSDRYVRDVESFASIGDQIKVKILSIDESNGFLRVSLKQVDESERVLVKNRSENKFPAVKADDFNDLKEKLPTWIDETLQKARTK